MPTKTKQFSVLNMRDTFDESSEALFNAIKKQNPNVDNFDQFDMELRQLVMRYGNGGYYGASIAEMTASIQEAKPIYNEAGDVFTLAQDAWKHGSQKEALKLCAVAMDCNDVGDLVEAIRINNSRSAIEELASSDNSEEEEDEDDDSSDGISDDETDDSSSDEDADGDGSDDEVEDEGDAEIQDFLSDEELEDPDDLLPTDDEDEEDNDFKAVARTIANLASLTDDEESDTSKNDESDEDESEKDEDESDDSVPMGSAGGSKTQASTLKRAMANKLSLHGTPEGLEKARKVMSR